MRKYNILIICTILVVVSILIGGIGSTKLKIRTSSIPKTIKKGEAFNIEVDTSLDKNDIKYTSSDNERVSISSGGLLTAIETGEVKITAYYEENGKTYYDDIKLNITD